MERWGPEADGGGKMRESIVLPPERCGLSTHDISYMRLPSGGLSPRLADRIIDMVSAILYRECATQGLARPRVVTL
jgi:hypothetical protein